MGELITLGRSEEDQTPRRICPHCKETILMDIRPFEKNVAKLMQSNCPKCRGVIFTGLLILAHPDLQGLVKTIQLIVNTVNSQNQILLK